MRLMLLGSCAALALSFTAAARAQTAPPPAWYPPPPGYPVTIIANDPKLQMDFSIDRASAPFVRCMGSCDLWLTPREYSVYVSETETSVAGRRKLKIEWPAQVTIEPRSKSSRQAGLILGVSGIVLIVAGAMAFVAASDTEEERRSEGTDAGMAGGVLAVLGGAVLTPLGWIKYARSAPQVEIEPR